MSETLDKPTDPRIISKVAKIDLRARMVVEGYVSGLHKSPFKGFSVEFAEHREYVPGDDLRYLDWKVFGKSDRYYVKQYEEETNLVCHILLDTSESMDFGTVGWTKAQYANTTAACLVHLIVQQHDAVGLATYDERVRDVLQPGSHGGHQRRCFSVIENAVAKGKTDLAQVLGHAAERLTKRGLVIVISDLVGDVEDVIKGLRRIRSRRHDVIVFQVLDPAEVDFPFERMTLFEGLEEYPELLADPKGLRDAYLEQMADFRTRLSAACLAERIDLVELNTRTPLDVALSSYLARRAAMRRR